MVIDRLSRSIKSNSSNKNLPLLAFVGLLVRSYLPVSNFYQDTKLNDNCFHIDCLGQYLTGIFYGFITFYAFPDTWLQYRFGTLIVLLATIVAVSFGVQIVGTLSARQCPFQWTFLGSLLGSTFSVLRGDNPFSLNVITLVCCLIFQWKVEWNPDYLNCSSQSSKNVNERVRRRHFVKRCLIFGFGAVLFCSIVSCAVYQNLQVEINGERVKIKDVLQSFFNSPQYLQLCQQLSGVFKQLWAFYLQYGFKGLWTHIWSILDLEGEKKALEVNFYLERWLQTKKKLKIFFFTLFQTLDLKADASQEEIKNKCRSLSGKWHPDRFRVSFNLRRWQKSLK